MSRPRGALPGSRCCRRWRVRRMRWWWRAAFPVASRSSPWRDGRPCIWPKRWRRGERAVVSVEVLAYVVVVCALSGFAHGALGFGFPLVATPLVALVIDMKSAIAILAPLTLVLTVISSFRGGPLMDVVRRFWFVPLATAAGAWLGTRVLIATPPEPF